jgi:hypothetical protein
MQSSREDEQILPEKAAAAAREAEAAAIREHRNNIYCPECGSDRITRIARSGFLHRYIYPICGLYPWRCVRCGVTSLLKWRVQPRRRHRHPKGAVTP